MAQCGFDVDLKADSEILRTTSSNPNTILPASMEPIQIKVLSKHSAVIVGPYRPKFWSFGCYRHPVTYRDGVPYSYKGFLIPLIYSAYTDVYLDPCGISAEYESQTESRPFR